MNQAINHVACSFRDPSGTLFWQNKLLYRTVNRSYQKHFDYLLSSGLYKKLTNEKLLIAHQELSNSMAFQTKNTYKTIQPELIPFISYPYEWSFSQLKDAALLTLSIQKIAIEHGMQLKDASAYNVQFKNGRPTFIDTLSFEIYEEGKPWVAYKQFCQHFLAPLALMACTDVDLNKLFRVYIDGIPLHLASKLLPFKTQFKPLFKLHVHMHANAQKKHEHTTTKQSSKRFTKTALYGLIDHLETGIKKLHWLPAGTEWAEYYQDDSYTQKAFVHKQKIIADFLDQSNPKTVWDLGGNDGTFSRTAMKKNMSVVTFDIDPASIEKNYLKVKKNNETNMLPLLLDLTNPSPGIGWHHSERLSLIQRGPVDLVMGLALIHHIAISNNVPFDKIAYLFSELGRSLIIEFVPKTDKKVQKLLATREDIFTKYDEKQFEKAFSNCFKIQKKENIQDSQRILYLMKNYK
ncbi:SAM-dependent methyltransferase [Candidatus Dependentiae bacterium]|nr:SAM-dependent methyltransferase [Candidatus Dependentiae bacterium]